MGLRVHFPFLLFAKMKNSYCFYKVRKSVRGVFSEEVGELADCSRATGAPAPCGLDRWLSRVCGYAEHSLPSRAFPSDPALCSLPRCGVDGLVPP